MAAVSSENSKKARIILTGATGRTGNAVAMALDGDKRIELSALVAPSVAADPTRMLPRNVPSYCSLEDALSHQIGEDLVLVDLTHADAARRHLDLALEHNLHVVLGTTGIEKQDLEQRAKSFATQDRGLFVVPNFSIGAVLAMRAVSMVAQYMPHAEIVELHHDAKRDCPSGTAIRTAELIEKERSNENALSKVASVDGASEDLSRGDRVHGVHIHSLRLPGATAHQEVVFGSPGELLTIRHDAIDRGCYAEGVVLAANYVIRTSGLSVGLDSIL